MSTPLSNTSGSLRKGQRSTNFGNSPRPGHGPCARARSECARQVHLASTRYQGFGTARRRSPRRVGGQRSGTGPGRFVPHPATRLRAPLPASAWRLACDARHPGESRRIRQWQRVGAHSIELPNAHPSVAAELPQQQGQDASGGRVAPRMGSPPTRCTPLRCKPAWTLHHARPSRSRNAVHRANACRYPDCCHGQKRAPRTAPASSLSQAVALALHCKLMRWRRGQRRCFGSWASMGFGWHSDIAVKFHISVNARSSEFHAKVCLALKCHFFNRISFCQTPRVHAKPASRQQRTCLTTNRLTRC